MAIPVIVVDPDEEYRELTLKTLEGSGQFTAIEATSAQEAAELITGSKIQIAIVDMDVSQDGGDIFLRKIREDNRHLLFIAIVGNVEVDTSLLDDLRIAAVIEKPYFLPELPSIIKNTIHPPKTKPPPDIQTESDPEQIFDDLTGPPLLAPEIDPKQMASEPAYVFDDIPELTEVSPDEAPEQIESDFAQVGIPTVESSDPAMDAELFQAVPSDTSAEILSSLEPTVDIEKDVPEPEILQEQGAEILSSLEPTADIEKDAPEPEILQKQGSVPLPTETSITSESRSAVIDALQDAPHWLNDPIEAASYLTQIFQEHSAHGLLLMRDGKLWAWSQHLGENRANLAVQTLSDHEIRAKNEESIFRYIRLEGEDADFLLYAIHVISTFTLVLLYEADKPFSLARRQAKYISQLLSDQEPADRPPADPIPAIEDQPVPEGHDQRSGLPDDWVPLSPSSMPILADFDVPPPDPGLEVIAAPQSPSLQIPSDWHPKQPMPAAYLPFLDDDSTSESEQQQSEPESDHNLPFTAVLLPHFPEHHLIESMASRISDWTSQLCLAWGWEAEIIEVLPDHLRLTLNLSSDIAVSQVIKHIAIDTSTRLIEAYPDQYSNLPSGQFWSNQYYLSAGKDLTSDQLDSFIKTARKSTH